MINVELDSGKGIAVLRPEGSLAKSDFVAVGARIDPYIEQHGKLNGIVIVADEFPGWHDFGAMLSHFTFVKNHHLDAGRTAAAIDWAGSSAD